MSGDDPRQGRPRLRAVPDLDSRSDEDLMELHRDGQPGAFDVLVNRHRRRLYAYLRRMGADHPRAEELVADTFLKVHRAAPRYEPTAKFTTWLFTIAYRATLNARDRWVNRPDRPAGGDAELDLHAGMETGDALERDPERSLSVKRSFAALEAELAELPDAHRSAFLLYYRQGLSCAEIAETLSITRAEAKGRLAYARKLLRERLAPHLTETEP